MAKINMGLIIDKIFRRTIYLRPLPDRSLEAIDITGGTEQYIKDKTGATTIDPSCIMRVRGIKRVDYIALKLSDATHLLNLFDSQKVTVSPPNVLVRLQDETVINKPLTVSLPERTTICPTCQTEHVVIETPLEVKVPDSVISIPPFEVAVPKIEIVVPDESQMTEKTFGDMLNYAEAAGRLQGDTSQEKDKKMNIILLLAGAAVLVGVFIYFKIQSGGG